MNCTNKIRLLHYFIIISILILSCGTKHTLKETTLFKDDNFTYKHLANNKMIIGGVSSKSVKLTDAARIDYCTLLSDIIFKRTLEKSPSINIINTRQLIYKIGEANFFSIMRDFDAEKVLTREMMQFVSDSMPDTKYILLAYIENENISDYSFEELIKDERGKEIPQTTYKKRYVITVEFQIYDIPQEKMVLHSSLYNEAERAEKIEQKPIDSVGDFITEVIVGESSDPAKIDREEVLTKIFNKLSENLIQ